MVPVAVLRPWSVRRRPRRMLGGAAGHLYETGFVPDLANQTWLIRLGYPELAIQNWLSRLGYPGSGPRALAASALRPKKQESGP